MGCPVRTVVSVALGIVDLQSHIGASLLQCRRSASYCLRFALTHDSIDIISVSRTRGVCVVSGQAFGGGLHHQHEQQGSQRVPLAHACAAVHWGATWQTLEIASSSICSASGSWGGGVGRTSTRCHTWSLRMLSAVTSIGGVGARLRVARPTAPYARWCCIMCSHALGLSSI